MLKSPEASQNAIKALALDLGHKSGFDANAVLASSTSFQNFMGDYNNPIQASIEARNRRGPVGGYESVGRAALMGGARGLKTGGKAVVNGLSQAGASTISLGYWEVEGPLAVTDWDRAMGYDISVGLARAGGEILIGVATGNAASGLTKLGTYGRYASYAARGFDAAGNVTQIGFAAGDMSVNGLTWQNSLQAAGAGLGTLGDYADLVPSVRGLGGVAPSKVGEAGQAAKNFLGDKYRVVTNKAGDKIFVSKDGLSKIRYDFKNPHGDNPHMHLEALKNGKWKDAVPGQHRFYPQ